MSWTLSREVQVVEPKLAQVFECEKTWRELVDRWAAFGHGIHVALPPQMKYIKHKKNVTACPGCKSVSIALHAKA